MERYLGRRFSALAPVVMSLVALLLVAIQLAIHGPGPERDEGALAHLYQLLVAGQVPVIAYFVFRWGRLAPRQGLRVVIAQAFALAAALVPVHLLAW